VEKNNKIEYKLLNYQKEAVQKLSEIDKLHRVSSAVMPTGAGKSFLAIAQMLKTKNPNYKELDDNGLMHITVGENGVINDIKIDYIAPTNEIAWQIKLDIVKYVLKKDTKELTSNEIDAEVKKAFPRLKFLCYKTLESDKINLDEETPDLVILDEVHRSGAKTFLQNTAQLLGCDIINEEPIFNPNSSKGKDKIQVFTISATPERDVDSRDMTKTWAKALGGYSDNELSDEVRADLGINLSLPEAQKMGILELPEIIYFDANLADSQEYQRLLKLEKNENYTLNLREKIRNQIDLINEKVIGIPNYDKMTAEEQIEAKEKKNIEVLANAIKNNKLNPHGKYILFVPHNITQKGENSIPTQEYLRQCGEKVQKNIEEALKGLEVDGIYIDFKYLSGNFSDKDNAEALKAFNDKDTSSGPLTFIVASEKLNEGVHAEKVSGSFMTRNISERENTTLRAQSILFLQQQGRTVSAKIPGKEEEKKVIFDLANNYYTQNRNGAIDKEQRIDLFELTPTQQILVDSYSEIVKQLPEKDISEKVLRLFPILDILSQYSTEINADIISSKETLNSLLEKEPFLSNYEDIVEKIENLGIINLKKDYKIGKRLEEARTAFWNGKKVFEEYSMEQLINYGVIDLRSQIGKKEFEKLNAKKEVVDNNGFIQMKVSEKFIGYNVYTGTIYDKNDKDREGYDRNEFDPETGKDKDGYYRNGFNDEGIHRETGMIHDIHGFMANGKNILTGTDLDKDGYNIKGLRPFYDTIDGEYIEIGGWERSSRERKGYFHRKLEDGSYSFKREEYLELSDGYKIDVHGFEPNGNYYYSKDKKKINDNGFYKSGEYSGKYYVDPETGEYDKYRKGDLGYDIDGYDVHGFNQEGIHRETGTPIDLEGRKKEFYKEAMEIKVEKENFFKSMYSKIFKGENEKIDKYKFDINAINTITNDYKDIFGFNMMSWYRTNGNVNDEGFPPPKMIYKSIINSNVKNNMEFYKNGINVLGTNIEGIMVEEGKLHPSLKLTYDYIKKTIQGEMTTEEFVNENAIKEMQLVSEARIKLNVAINQALTLYRICPDLQKSQQAKEVIKILTSSNSKKIQDFSKICDLANVAELDCSGYKEMFKNYGKHFIKENNKEEKDNEKIEKLKRQALVINKKIETLDKLKSLALDDR